MPEDNSYDACLKIVLIGDSGRGKTSLLNRFARDEFHDKMVGTIGIDFTIKTISLEEMTFRLQIWDTAGQERYLTVTTAYLPGAEVVIVVYDVCDQGSLQSVRNWMMQIQAYAKSDVLVLIVGNKCDVGADKRAVSTEEGRELAESFGRPFMEVSAKLDINVNDMFKLAALLRLRQLQGERNCVSRDNNIRNYPIPRRPWLYAVDDSLFENHWRRISWCDESVCYVCVRPFSWIFLSTHHCRVCGHCVCNTCSRGRKTLPSLGYRMVAQRVCDYCMGQRQAQMRVLRRQASAAVIRPLSSDQQQVSIQDGIRHFTKQIPFTFDRLSYLSGGSAVFHRVSSKKRADADKSLILKHYQPWIWACGFNHIVEREIDCLKKFSHSNIISSVFSHVQSPFGCVVLPFYSLGNLAEFGRQRWAEANYQRTLFDWLWIMRVTVQVSSALQYIHSQGYFFNNLVTRHVLVVCDAVSACRVDDEAPLVKLIDFTNVITATNPRNRLLLLPPTHRPPECWRWTANDPSRDDVDMNKIEVFAFGMFLAQVITVTDEKFLLAYKADEAEIVMGKQILEGVRPILADQSRTGKELSSIAKQCWVGNPTDRPLLQLIAPQLLSIERSLDQARCVENKYTSDVYEFTALEMTWIPVETFGPGPTKARYTKTDAQSDNQTRSLFVSVAAGFQQMAATMGYSSTVSQTIEMSNSVELEFDIPDGKWCRIERQCVRGRALKRKNGVSMFAAATSTASKSSKEKVFDMPSNVVRKQFYNTPPDNINLSAHRRWKT